MQLPTFPDSRELTLSDKALFDSLFAARPPEISAYTFTNLFAWRVPYGTRISSFKDMVIVHHNIDGHEICLEPFGDGDPVSTIDEILRLYPETRFERVHADVARSLSQYKVEVNRNDSDYLYASKDLIDLPGRKFDGKRNFLKRFKQENSWEYVVLDKAVAAECVDFAHEWCVERKCETIEGLRREFCALYEMLVYYSELNIFGGALRVDGRIAAFEIGEVLNPDTIVIHAEKGDSGLYGVYQTINNEFCIHEAGKHKFVNREQDLGVPGLRKAKESYHPIKLVEAYSVKVQ